MTPADFLALSKEERCVVCANLEFGSDATWLVIETGNVRFLEGVPHGSHRRTPDYSDPRNSSRLIARAIEERPWEFYNCLLDVMEFTEEGPEQREKDLASASDDQRLACAVCALEGV